MIGAGEALAIALVAAADLGATMGAGVEECPGHALIVPAENGAAAGKVAAHKIVGFRDFRFMADELPAMIENALPLFLEHGRVRISRAMHLEVPALRIDLQKARTIWAIPPHDHLLCRLALAAMLCLRINR
jgi:hypothetical protein